MFRDKEKWYILESKEGKLPIPNLIVTVFCANDNFHRGKRYGVEFKNTKTGKRQSIEITGLSVG